MRNTRILSVAACLLAIAGFWLPKHQPFEMPETLEVNRITTAAINAAAYALHDTNGKIVGGWEALDNNEPRLTMETGRGSIELHVAAERGLITANGFAMNDDKGRRRGIMGTHESVAVISLYPEHDDGPQSGLLAGDGLAVVGAWQNASAQDGATLTANSSESQATLLRLGQSAWTTPKR